MVEAEEVEREDENLEKDSKKKDSKDESSEKEDSEDESSEDEDSNEDEEGEDSEEEEDFFIGDTTLSSGGVDSVRSRRELEEVIRNERIERDWGDSEEFVAPEVYRENSGRDDFSGRGAGDNFYEDVSREEDLYKGGNGADLYNTGDVYSAGGRDENKLYDTGRDRLKGYDFEKKDRGVSVLESMGFGSERKKDKRNLREYSAKEG